jgi:hypothetical protein
MIAIVTIAAAAATGALILIVRWFLSRSLRHGALGDVTVSRDWLSRHQAQDRS